MTNFTFNRAISTSPSRPCLPHIFSFEPYRDDLAFSTDNLATSGLRPATRLDRHPPDHEQPRAASPASPGPAGPGQPHGCRCACCSTAEYVSSRDDAQPAYSQRRRKDKVRARPPVAVECRRATPGGIEYASGSEEEDPGFHQDADGKAPGTENPDAAASSGAGASPRPGPGPGAGTGTGTGTSTAAAATGSSAGTAARSGPDSRAARCCGTACSPRYVRGSSVCPEAEWRPCCRR